MDSISKNSTINFKIKNVSIDGNGIGVCGENGMTVFCFGKDTGEELSGTVIKKTASYIVAKSDKKTVSEKCGLYPGCGGCSLLHFPYERTLEIKENHVRDCLRRIGGLENIRIDPIIPSPETCGFRNKALYRFKKTGDEIKCGFFRRNSHDVVEGDSCFSEKPLCRKVCGSVLKILNGRHFSVYDETAARGFLRALLIRVSVYGRAMVCISANGKNLPDEKEIARELMSEIPEVESFYFHSNTFKTNTVLEGEFKLVAGRKTLKDEIGGAVFEISPEAFFQVNPYATVKLYDKALEYALAGFKRPVTLLDLYCGIGTIGIYFAKKSANMIGSIFGADYTKAAIDEAKKAASENGITAAAEYAAGDAGKLLSGEGLPENARAIIEKADVVVVDPPRKGLGAGIPEMIDRLPAKRIVYVSCNPATLARDLVSFRELSWEVVGVTPVDMFPFEGHVETVCLLNNKFA